MRVLAALVTVRTPQPQNLSPNILKTSFTTGSRISIPNPYISSCYFSTPLLTRLRPPPSRHWLNSPPAHRSLHRHPAPLARTGWLNIRPQPPLPHREPCESYPHWPKCLHRQLPKRRGVRSPASIHAYSGLIFYLCLQIGFLFWLLNKLE
jgi:hypothetical protein